MKTRIIILLAVLAAFAGPSAAMAHVHTVATGSGRVQELANGQNHPGSSGNESCGIVDPAGYGLETAHHGPDSGDPGRADGACYTRDGVPDDENPAID